MNAKYILTCIVYLCFFLSSKGQDAEAVKTPLSERIYYGGGVGLSLGTITSVNINPMVGYKFTSQLSAGVTLTYQYLKRNDEYYKYESNSYGGSLFSRYRFTDELYGHVEYANINYDFFTLEGKVASREWVPFLLVGGGYSNQIGQNSVFYAQILFDVLQNELSPYESGQPIYSMGVGIGF